MRAIVQRVSAATVTVDGREVGRCGEGLALLVAVHKDDTEANANKLAEKIANLRVFNDADGKMNLGIRDFPADPGSPHKFDRDVLAVSNFTVYGDTRNRRPSFIDSASYELGERLFDHFIQTLRGLEIQVQTGVFGADMHVSLINDGPVTVIVEA